MEQQVVVGKRRRGPAVLISILLTLLLLVTLACVLLFIKYQDAQTSNAAMQRNDLVTTIGKSVLLPSDEEPGLSTVIDRTKLSNDTLRSRAENGDKLLIYAKAGRLIIYRPSSGKVVDILTIQSSETKESAAATTDEP